MKDWQKIAVKYCLMFSLSALLTLILTQCGPRYTQTSYDDTGALLPKVVIAPIQIHSPHPINWDYQEELTQTLEQELQKLGFARIITHSQLTNQQKIPSETLWDSSDLRLASEFQGADFLILCKLVDYDKRQVATKHLKNRPEKILKLRAQVRVINLTQAPYRLALQEYIEIEDIISPKQEFNSKDIVDWTSPNYRHSHFEIATNKLCFKLSQRIVQAVQLAWKQRSPLSSTSSKKTL